MHPSERLPIEDELRPAPGVPKAVLRRQVEVAEALQSAIIHSAVEHDSICAFNYAQALSTTLEGIRELSEAEDFERERTQEMLERELAELRQQ